MSFNPIEPDSRFDAGIEDAIKSIEALSGVKVENASIRIVSEGTLDGEPIRYPIAYFTYNTPQKYIIVPISLEMLENPYFNISEIVVELIVKKLKEEGKK